MIRFAHPKDLSRYTDLLQQTYEFAYTNDQLGLTKECFSKEVFSTPRTQEYLQSHLINSDMQKTWLAFDDTTLVGSITCTLKNEQEAELSGFYVHPQFQRKGLGKKLYTMALEFVGKRNILLDIYVHNVKTIEFYKRWGWKLDTSRGNKGYFSRHWEEWPKELEAACMYMKLERR